MVLYIVMGVLFVRAVVANEDTYDVCGLLLQRYKPCSLFKNYSEDATLSCNGAKVALLTTTEGYEVFADAERDWVKDVMRWVK